MHSVVLESNSCPPRVALFGGTFDPIHWGHLGLAQAALKQFDLQGVLWVPALAPAYKAHRVTAYVHRAAMVRAAIAPYPPFELSAAAPCTSARDTFRALQQTYRDRQWYWLLGSDSFCTLPRWHQRQQLVPALTWLVAPRVSGPRRASLGDCRQAVRALEGQGLSIDWEPVAFAPSPLSSTQVRQAAAASCRLDNLVPPAVSDYIATNQLYNEQFPRF